MEWSRVVCVDGLGRSWFRCCTAPRLLPTESGARIRSVDTYTARRVDPIMGPTGQACAIFRRIDRRYRFDPGFAVGGTCTHRLASYRCQHVCSVDCCDTGLSSESVVGLESDRSAFNTRLNLALLGV